MAGLSNSGIPLCRVSPGYLQANSTSHTTPFSAIAELIDNSYDPDVGAKRIWIDKTVIKDKDCIIFMDSGKGMDYEKMHKMLSFGFNEKKAVRGHAPVGRYGNGFKSGSMRLGKDAIVFSKKASTMCVGLLSQTYLEETGAQNVVVPIVMFTKTGETDSATPEHAASLRDILKYSLFDKKEALLSEFSIFKWLCSSSNGTRIIIWNLHRTSSGELELDFKKDDYDFQIPSDVCESSSEANELQPEGRLLVPDSVYSLRAYCSILYLKPRMQIILQGNKVESQFVSKTLALSLKDSYKPDCIPPLEKPVPITFGYNAKNKRHFGLMMYHNNRLIKAYERVACQRKAKIIGAGIIGVMECNYLTPTHNKQDFENTEIYRKTMINVSKKLEEYWKEVHHRYNTNMNCTKPLEKIELQPDQNWVICEKCFKWRKLPDGIDNKQLPDKWFCYMNRDPKFRSCEVEEEPDDSHDAPVRFQRKHKQNEQIQKLQQNRQQHDPSTSKPVQIMPNNPFNDIQHMYLPGTQKRKKKAQDLVPESAEKRARIRALDEMLDLSRCLPAMFSQDSNVNNVDCKDIKAPVKYNSDVIDKDLLKKEPSCQTTQSSCDYQQNYKGLYLQIKEAMKHLQDKLIEFKKMLKEEGVDTKMDSLEYEQWRNCCESLQNDLEKIKTGNVEVTTEAPSKEVGSQTWKKETQDRSEIEEGQTDEIHSLPEMREIRENVTRLLVSYVPAIELEQVINKVLSRVLDGITPRVASLLTKGTKSPDEHILFVHAECEGEDNQSIPTEQFHTKYHSAVTDVFVPESVKHNAKSGAYRFLCSHAGQFHCKFTNIVFELKAKGEVLYTVESWDNSQLQGMGQFQPAGALYNITCPEDSINYMHFPHCEIYNDLGQNQTDLAVAHFSDGNVEIIQPLKITNTHVIFEVHGLSIFGLLKKIFWESPISAQVLLFYKELIGMQRRKKLHIHLVPGNVAVEEVQKRHQSSTYIPCSSTCQLIPGKKYRPLCEPYVSQPKAETFGCDYGPNYHPTYEVIFNTEVEDLTLGLLDEIGQEVWEPRQVLLTAEMREGAPDLIDDGATFVDNHRDMLIQRVLLVTGIADTLLTGRMISNETYSDIRKAATSQEKMRILYRSLDSGGSVVKGEFYKVLKEKEPFLVIDLECNTSNA